MYHDLDTHLVWMHSIKVLKNSLGACPNSSLTSTLRLRSHSKLPNISKCHVRLSGIFSLNIVWQVRYFITYRLQASKAKFSLFHIHFFAIFVQHKQGKLIVLSFLTTLEYLMFNPAKSNKHFNSSKWQDLWPRLNMSFNAKNCVALCGMTKYRIFAHSQWSTVQNYVTCWNVSLLPFIFADLFSSIDWLETQHLESTLPHSKKTTIKMAPGTNTEQTTAVETPNSTDPAYTGQAVGKCPFQVIQALVINK